MIVDNLRLHDFIKTRSIIESIKPLTKKLEKISKKPKICQKYSCDSGENNKKMQKSTWELKFKAESRQNCVKAHRLSQNCIIMILNIKSE